MPLKTIFKSEKPVIAMLHLPALPGSPGNTEDLNAIRKGVLRDAAALAEGGVDGLIIENFGDSPFFPNRVPPHTVAFMTVLAQAVQSVFPLPMGVNVLRNDGLSALAIAAAIDAAFVRVNIYTAARLTDQGIIQGEAHRIQRYRRLLGSQVQVFADVAVKHSAPLAPRDLRDEVQDTIVRGRADAVIVSGSATGQETRVEDVKIVKENAGETPVLVGSGVNLKTVEALFPHADGFIAGTALKMGGRTTSAVDRFRVREFMKLVQKLRRG